jgi:hypothetical protein
MNRIPKIASYWRGRILMKITTEECKKPRCLMEDISSPDMENLVKGTFEQGPEYEIRVQLFSGAALPKKYSSYKIAVRWGDTELETE